MKVLNVIYEFIKQIRFLKNGGLKINVADNYTLAESLCNTIPKFYPNINCIYEQYLRYDMINEFIKHKVTPLEYCLFDFMHKNEKERDSFLPDFWMDALSRECTPYNLFKTQLSDKYEFYKLNKKYFARNVIKITYNTTFEEFYRFAEKYKTLFIKPLYGCCGQGVFILRFPEDNVEMIYNDLINSGNSYMVEELITQSEYMNRWNSSSVNTVRVPTILSSDGFHVLGCYMRTGRNGNIVDNAGSGGILAAVDEENGVCISDGVDESGKHYEVHPDSNIRYKGFKIPEWSSLLEIAEQAHRNMCRHKYIAYDFAHTNNGWIIIEGNWGQFLSQYATGVGLKQQFTMYMKDQ